MDEKTRQKEVCDEIVKKGPQWIGDGRELMVSKDDLVGDKTFPQIKTKKNETWKDIKGWEGLYQVSDLGRVRSLKRKQSGPGNVRQQKILSPDNKNKVVLANEGKQWGTSVSRLVLTAFAPPKEHDSYVAYHINGNCKDSRVSNLRWRPRPLGESFRNNRPVQCTLTGKVFGSMKEAAFVLGIGYQTVIRSIKEDRTVLHKYKFKKLDV